MIQENKTSRRNFLKTSALASVTAATLGSGLNVHAAGSDEIKIGIVGCGGRGMGAVRDNLTAVPNSKLVAMGELFEDRAQAARGALKEDMGDRVDVPDSNLFTGLDSYQGVVEKADVVLIACASRFHPLYAKTAVEAGRHVFVEKPHGIDPAGVRQIYEASKVAEKNQTAFVSGLCYRYDTLRRQAVEQVRSGLIGDIVAVQCDYIRTPYCMVKRQEGWSEVENQFRNWYHFTWLTGDEILQSLLHNLDSAIWMLNEDIPKSAYGTGGRSATYRPEFGDLFDHTSITYDYEDGRCIYGTTRAADNCFYSNKDVFHGAKGRCYFHAFDQPYITDLDGKQIWISDKKRERNPYVQEHYEMMQSIIDGKPINDGERMSKTTMTAILGFLACRCGQELNYQETWDSNFRFGPAEEDISLDMQPLVEPGEDGLYPVAVPGTTKDL
ncbi:MAG: Gfo/Idh/MocA family oxidoreductase [Planctomycetia bacterium]|nr:Gfo/Idh/MocA family oxidoreductase [Planctomycetia bacterium]